MRANMKTVLTDAIIAALGIAACGFAFYLFSVWFSSPSYAHEFYNEWRQPMNPTASCCNEYIPERNTGDCEPVEGRYDEKTGKYWAKRPGRDWEQVPDEVILDPTKPENKSPGGWHGCWNRTTGKWLCFRTAEIRV